MDLLVVLVESAGTLVSKEELMHRVWPDTFVEEGNLPVTVFTLRKALGDDGEAYIKTIAKRGYTFVADVQDGSQPEEAHQKALHVPAPESALREGLITADDVSPLEKGATATRHAGLRAAAVVAGLAIVLAGLAYAWSRAATPSPTAALGSVAVLPLTLTDIDSSDEYLAVGLAADVVGRLTGLPNLSVRPLSSSLKFTGPSQDAVSAGRALQTAGVVTGSIRATGHRLRASAQLTRVSDGARLWTLPAYDSDAGLLDVAGRIAAGVAAALTSELAPDARASLTRPRTASVDAYRRYLEGLSLAHQFTVRDLASSLDRFEQAVRADPDYAEAHAALAVFTMLPASGSPEPSRVARAKVAALRAIELDDTLGLAHAALGAALSLGEMNWEGAGEQFRVAIAQRPNDPEIRLWRSVYQSALGRHDEALDEIRIALELDPTSPRVNLYGGNLLFMARRYDEAIAQFRRTPIELGVVNQQIYLGIALANAKKGRFDQARASLERVLTRTDNPQGTAHLALVLAQEGKRQEAAEALRHTLQSRAGRVPHMIVAATYACLGRTTEALAHLERAHHDGDLRRVFGMIDPALDCARADPRFTDFVRRIGLRSAR